MGESGAKVTDLLCGCSSVGVEAVEEVGVREFGLRRPVILSQFYKTCMNSIDKKKNKRKR